MEEFPQISPELSKALTLFFEELKAHLEFFEKASSEDFAKKAEQRMHLIKGGAGFFKFSKIQSFTKENENYFKGKNLKDLDSKIELIKSTLKQFITDLERYYPSQLKAT